MRDHFLCMHRMNMSIDTSTHNHGTMRVYPHVHTRVYLPPHSKKRVSEIYLYACQQVSRDFSRWSASLSAGLQNPPGKCAWPHNSSGMGLRLEGLAYAAYLHHEHDGLMLHVAARLLAKCCILTGGRAQGTARRMSSKSAPL